MNTTKQRLLILSDLWGKEKSDWITYYTSILVNHFELEYYDSCDLGTINKSDYSEENLHNQFINGGIEKAVVQLVKKEKVSLIGFGTFETRERAARTGRNPQTGAELKIAASITPAFKPGKALKEKVNQ